MASIPGSLLPGVRLALGGPVQLRLTGSLEITPRGLRTTFDQIPDVPLERLVLSFMAGGPLQVVNPCTGSLLRMTADLTGHNGAQATAPARLTLRHCPLLGSARATRARRPALRIDLHHGRDAGPLRLVTFTLPARATGLRASAGGRRLARRDVRVRGRVVTLRLGGAKDLTLRGRLRSRPSGPVRIAATRVGGQRAALRLRVTRLR
jgi:hypothetical protein